MDPTLPNYNYDLAIIDASDYIDMPPPPGTPPRSSSPAGCNWPNCACVGCRAPQPQPRAKRLFIDISSDEELPVGIYNKARDRLSGATPSDCEAVLRPLFEMLIECDEIDLAMKMACLSWSFVRMAMKIRRVRTEMADSSLIGIGDDTFRLRNHFNQINWQSLGLHQLIDHGNDLPMERNHRARRDVRLFALRVLEYKDTYMPVSNKEFQVNFRGDCFWIHPLLKCCSSSPLQLFGEEPDGYFMIPLNGSMHYLI